MPSRSQMSDTGAPPGLAAVLLYWLPLGSGGNFVRWNGRVFETLAAIHDRRPVHNLYHSALQVIVGRERFVVEMTPAWGTPHVDRGVVREGPVGVRGLGRFAAFRYEIRCWLGGVIPDWSEAVDSPRLVSADAGQARQILDLVPQVPALTWGRDESRTGEMWNSNSVTAWLLARAGVRLDDCRPPPHGRAPGWQAGVVLAAGQVAGATPTWPIGPTTR